jgi:DNA-binding Lrp family transcriptional regulator
MPIDDDLDSRILDALSADARQPISSIARRLGVARSTVQERIRRLERTGVIAGYTVRLGPEATGRRIVAHAQLTVDPKLAQQVVRSLSAIPEIRRVQTVSGPFDLVAVLAAATPTDMDEALDRIGAIAGIARTTSAIVLATKLER